MYGTTGANTRVMILFSWIAKEVNGLDHLLAFSAATAAI
jgi:hypothetical protein